jgi:hypothetical protein
MWLILEILVWLLEVCYLWRFYSMLLAALAVVGLGDWLLPEASALRGMGMPLVVGWAIAGLIWEVVASREKKLNPKIITLADKEPEKSGESE